MSLSEQTSEGKYFFYKNHFRNQYQSEQTNEGIKKFLYEHWKLNRNSLNTFLYFEQVKIWKQSHKLKYKLATYKAITNIGIMILLFSHSLSGLKAPSHAMRISLLEIGRWNSCGAV